MALLDGALQALAKIHQRSDELRSCWRKGSVPAAAHEDCKADLLLQQPELIGKVSLLDEHCLRCPAEIQRVGQFDAIIDLFGVQGVLRLLKYQINYAAFELDIAIYLPYN